MNKKKNINLQTIKLVAAALEEINNIVVFVGGAIVSLYADEPGAEAPRPTKDIDISVQISSYTEMNKLREKLAQKSIYPALTEKIMYRFQYRDILIDFIPTVETSLGPANSWLRKGYSQHFKYDLDGTKINILPVAYYLASKWEAFVNRAGDYRTSHDFEDIVYVIDNNLHIPESILQSNWEVKNFILKKFNELLINPYLDEILSCHLNPITANERKEMIIKKLKLTTEGS